MLSIFDLFKIGIGPSSSHTVGPMVAAHSFVLALQDMGLVQRTHKIVVDIHGSLALTGKGHHTDAAIILGLAGFKPDTVVIEEVEPFLEAVQKSKQLALYGREPPISFSPDLDMVFHHAALPLHENGLTINAFGADELELLFSQTYYSVGGGFVMTADELLKTQETQKAKHDEDVQCFDCKTAEKLLSCCVEQGLSIADVTMKNELMMRGEQEIVQRCNTIWGVMQNCITRGIQSEGILPGPLQVPRRAEPLYKLLNRLENEQTEKDPLLILDWVNLFAIAVSEENAVGGRVVTAPTNGACGIIPAILAYYDRFVTALSDEKRVQFFLTAGAVGLLYKRNASISGAEVGCQGEVGVACSMAAAGLAALLGGTPEQVCIAAEIGMEHNLGLTCDPVAGQVQIPCIERNAIAATKAINAARMALKRSGKPAVSLDAVIKTMLETGKDMNVKYRETSLGGLAIGVGMRVEC